MLLPCLVYISSLIFELSIHFEIRRRVAKIKTAKSEFYFLLLVRWRFLVNTFTLFRQAIFCFSFSSLRASSASLNRPGIVPFPFTSSCLLMSTSGSDLTYGSGFTWTKMVRSLYLFSNSYFHWEESQELRKESLVHGFVHLIEDEPVPDAAVPDVVLDVLGVPVAGQVSVHLHSHQETPDGRAAQLQ